MTRQAPGPEEEHALTRSQFLGIVGVGALTLAAAACGGGSSQGSGTTTPASTAAETGGADTSAGTTAEEGLPTTGGAPLANGGSLNLYTYPNYAVKDSLGEYKKATGTTINVSTFDSNEAALAKLNTAGGAGFDIIIPTNPFIPEFVEKGLLLELDKSLIPWQYVDERLLGLSFDPNNDYTVPRAYGTIGVIYDPSAVGTTLTSWQQFFDLGEKPGISGKVNLGFAAYENFGAAFWALGLDWNTQDENEIRQAGDKLKAFAKNVRAFNGYDVDGYINGAVAMGVTTQDAARFAVEGNSKLEFVIPEPASELWIDNFAILADAPNPDQAYSFINFELEPERQISETGVVGLPGPLPDLESMIPASVPLRELIFIPPDDFPRLTPFVIQPETQALMTQLFSEIQAAAGA